MSIGGFPAFPLGRHTQEETAYRPELFLREGGNYKAKLLVGGQGLLVAGTVVGMVTSGTPEGRLRQYSTTTSDGSGTAYGILAATRDTGTDGDTTADYVTCIVVVADATLNKSVVSGSDANAITDLGARVMADPDLDFILP
jgi:hypothetical protein